VSAKTFASNDQMIFVLRTSLEIMITLPSVQR